MMKKYFAAAALLVTMAACGSAAQDTPLKAFSKGDYKGYEFIDFR